MREFVCLVVFVLTGTLGLALLTQAAQVDSQLEGIKKKIEKEKKGIGQVHKKEGSILQSLGKIDKDLERKTKELKTVDARLERVLADLKESEQQAQELNRSVEERRKLLKKRALALYRWQRGGSPFVILGGGFSLGELMRRRRYLEATLAYDQELIKGLSQELARQARMQQGLARKRQEVDIQRKALVELKKSARKEAEKKREILASLRREKELRTRALKELEEAAHRLQKMMDEINRKAVASSKEVPSGVDFEAMRGKLEFPIRGEVMGEFGKTRHPEFSAEVFRKGIDIEAPLGEEIKAVEKGKVVFADRFSGYGKMLIVDHGQRYYTVYAHLSDLLKKPGDMVQRGEPIALVGDSDSLAGARLYFEIRKDGKPVDPLPWFKRR